jgi:hypothetical protein
VKELLMPKENLTKLNVKNGTPSAPETPDGIEPSPHDMDFTDQRKAMMRVMKENRDVLKRLAE